MGHEQKYPVYFPLSDMLNLKFHLRDTRPGVDPDEFVVQLVRRWLTLESERLTLRQEGKPLHGFQWKSVFLPDGTHLRSSYNRTVQFAKVVGDQIMAEDGEVVTPSEFANRHAKGRNAWRVIWIRFSGDAHWIRAADCRAGGARGPGIKATKKWATAQNSGSF
jgi:hypothetical protein